MKILEYCQMEFEAGRQLFLADNHLAGNLIELCVLMCVCSIDRNQRVYQKKG